MNTALQATAVLLPGLSFISFLVNREVPKPYLDEIFHIPQAQQYCLGEFAKWDPSITTPPGLYLLSTALSWTVRHTCDRGFLRCTNVLLAATVLPWSVVGILHATHRHAALWEVLAISCFPLVTFFSLLYYTDVGSTAFVILGYWAAQEKRYVWSAFAGLASLLFRQTNVVWIAFTAATSILKEYAEVGASPATKPKPLLQISSPGHQEMHVATLHFPQVLYFLAFATIFGWPVLMNEGVESLAIGTARTGLGSMWRALISILVLAAMNFMVANYTISRIDGFGAGTDTSGRAAVLPDTVHASADHKL
ncbi:hypothetical protein QFC21_000397 [Naganishia friedmannii]|uniref:Uncharacterized protein n=1 Tax=Naganishia friedmannii TaxID=89922 RepID=A0ACC2WCJ8_9TREE|nr:hypothetical protein QFC21_000397 [Naganishia friedmannii]